jgi:hypothetical protein
LLLTAGYLTKDQFQQLYCLSQSTGNLIGGFIRYLGASEPKGAKHK